MTTHSYIRPGGVWNTGQPVYHGEFAALDFAQFDSISSSGGTYSPAAPIILGGAGVTFTGSNSSLAPGSTFTSYGDMVFAIGSTQEFIGAATFSGTTAFDGFSRTNFYGGSVTTFFPSSNLVFAAGSTQEFIGAATFSGTTVFDGFSTANFYGGSTTTFFPSSNLQFEGRLTSTAGLFTLGDSSTFHSTGNFYFGGGGAFVGGVTFAGPTTNFAGASVRFTAPTELGGHTTLTNDLLITGAGGIAERVVIGADSGTNTYSVSTVDLVWVPAVGPVGATYYVDNVGAVNGKRIRFALAFGAFTSTGPFISIRRSSDGAVLFLLGERPGISSRCIELMFIGNTWQWIPGALS